jgi:hypothetical protein
MEVPQVSQYEGFEDDQENYEEEFSSPGLCSLRELLFVAIRYAVYGLFVAGIVHIVPTYGSAISNAELAVIGAVAAGVILVGERIIPDSSWFALR